MTAPTGTHGRGSSDAVAWITSNKICSPNQQAGPKRVSMTPIPGESSTCSSSFTDSQTRKINSTALPQPEGWFWKADAQRPSGRRGGGEPWTGGCRRVAGLTSSRSAVSHLGALRRAGLSDAQLAALAGITVDELQAVEDIKDPWDPRAAAIVSIGFTPTDSRRTTPAVGARRRVRALMTLGWSFSVLADRTGFSSRELRRLVSSDEPRRVTSALWWSVYDTFEALSGTVGPDQTVRDKAAARGWAAPLAWDDEEIDHPDCGPHMPTDEPGVVDTIAVERVLHDEYAADIKLNKAEIDAVLDAYDADKDPSTGPESRWKIADLARMLGKTEEAAERQLTRHRSRLQITTLDEGGGAVLRRGFGRRQQMMEQDQVCRAVS